MAGRPKRRARLNPAKKRVYKPYPDSHWEIEIAGPNGEYSMWISPNNPRDMKLNMGRLLDTIIEEEGWYPSSISWHLVPG